MMEPQGDGAVGVGTLASWLWLGAPEQPLRAHEQHHHQHQKGQRLLPVRVQQIASKNLGHAENHTPYQGAKEAAEATKDNDTEVTQSQWQTDEGIDAIEQQVEDPSHCCQH